MAKIPSDIVEGIKKLSETRGMPVKSLVERLKKIKDTNENIKTMEKEDFKIRFAWAIMLRELATSGSDYYIMPICFPRVREITSKGEKTKVGNIAALIQKITKKEDGTTSLGKVQYGSGTFWRDAAENLKFIETGKVYKTSLVTKDNSWGITITSNNTSFIPVDFKMTSFIEYFNNEIKSEYPIITIEEMDAHKSDTPTDIKMIKATITDADVREDTNGNEYGFYDATDQSVIGTRNLRIFVDPKDVIFMQGSIVLFGGTIEIDDDGRTRWTHHYQIPTKTVEKRQVVIKAPKKAEEVDIDLDNEIDTSLDDEIVSDQPKSKKETEPADVSDEDNIEDDSIDDELNFEV